MVSGGRGENRTETRGLELPKQDKGSRDAAGIGVASQNDIIAWFCSVHMILSILF